MAIEMRATVVSPYSGVWAVNVRAYDTANKKYVEGFNGVELPAKSYFHARSVERAYNHPANAEQMVYATDEFVKGAE